MAAGEHFVLQAGPDTTSLGIRLLADLRDIFTHAATGGLRTTDILTTLNNLDESPWGDLEGKPLDARRLAKELARYNVKPKPFKVKGESVKGYQTTGSHGLADAWDRYLPPQDPQDPTAIGNPVTRPVTAVTAVTALSRPSRRTPTVSTHVAQSTPLRASRVPHTRLTIADVCADLGVSRSTFYE